MKPFRLLPVSLRLASALLFTAAVTHAGEIVEQRVSAAQSHAEAALRENVLEVELESGAAWNLNGDRGYFVAPQLLSLNWNLDDIGLDGWHRGNTQFKFTALMDPVVQGPENHLLGAVFGPQYNFVQPGSNFVPFVGARVGIVFVDSGPDLKAQAQDFDFTFMVTAGVRYYFTDHLSASVEVNYEHASNGGLSEPERKNNGLNLLGPQVGVQWAF